MDKSVATLSDAIIAGLSCACPRCGRGELLLQPTKGLLIALQYHHRAAEKRFGESEP